MIRKRTVFVLGAGASMPFGFPSGLGLLKEVLKEPARSDDARLLYECGFEPAELERFKDALAHSGRMSVDAFLETRTDLIKVGKAMMAIALSKHEHTSALFDPEKKGVSNWYDYLFASMATVNPQELEANSVSFVTFNYDRSLEMYLGSAIESNYKDYADVRNVLQKFRIVHVHGKLANLPVEGGATKQYRAEMTMQEFKAAQDGLRIIHEIQDEEDGLNQARQLLHNADIVIFLGFGFLELNVSRLQLDRCERGTAFFGTAYGLTGAEQNSVRHMFDQRIELHDSDSLRFLRETGLIAPIPRIHVSRFP